MKCYVYTTTGDTLLRTEEATPVCGQDFCDRCGDCLACYDDNSCTDEDGHTWVKYEDVEAAK